MTTDSLVFLGPSRFGTNLELPRLRASMEELQIARAVVCPPHPPGNDFRRANRELAHAVQSAAGDLTALARVDPWDGEDAHAHLSEAIASLDVRGLFLHPAEENFRILAPMMRSIVDKASEAGLPVVVATGYPWLSEAIQVAELARWAAPNPVILTNGGQYNISGLSQTDAELALQDDNVHILTTGVYREDFLRNVISKFGAERVLYASGAPLFDMKYELRRVTGLPLPDKTLRQLLSDNASRVFGVPQD